MNGCPFHKVAQRDDLPPLTPRIEALPRDERGYPVPFFVGWPNGKADFRTMDGQKWMRCIRERLCWVCGQKLGNFVTFTIGPMCTINRTTAEPPGHKECAEWSVRGCPFLSRPNMARRENNMPEGTHDPAGVMIRRNPGVSAVWTVKLTPEKPLGYKLFPDGNGSHLIRIGRPCEVTWWREGRPATREECLAAIDSGLPLLQQQCDLETLASERDKAHFELAELTAVAAQYLPAAQEKSRIILA